MVRTGWRAKLEQLVAQRLLMQFPPEHCFARCMTFKLLFGSSMTDGARIGARVNWSRRAQQRPRVLQFQKQASVTHTLLSLSQFVTVRGCDNFSKKAHTHALLSTSLKPPSHTHTHTHTHTHPAGHHRMRKLFCIRVATAAVIMAMAIESQCSLGSSDAAAQLRARASAAAARSLHARALQ